MYFRNSLGKRYKFVKFFLPWSPPKMVSRRKSKNNLSLTFKNFCRIIHFLFSLEKLRMFVYFLKIERARTSLYLQKKQARFSLILSFDFKTNSKLFFSVLRLLLSFLCSFTSTSVLWRSSVLFFIQSVQKWFTINKNFYINLT